MTQINDVVYRIKRGPKTKMKIVHLDRLMKYDSDTIDVSGRLELRRGQCYEINPYAGPVRRLWVFYITCAAMMGDSSSVTAVRRRSLKKRLEAEVAMGIRERPRSRNI